LPAFLLAELRDEYKFSLIFTLTYLGAHRKQKFLLLNKEQRQAVRNFLEWAMDDDDYKFDQEKIIEALSYYWQ